MRLYVFQIALYLSSCIDSTATLAHQVNKPHCSWDVSASHTKLCAQGRRGRVTVLVPALVDIQLCTPGVTVCHRHYTVLPLCAHYEAAAMCTLLTGCTSIAQWLMPIGPLLDGIP